MMRRIAVEEPFITAGVLAGWKKVPGRSDVEPGSPSWAAACSSPSLGHRHLPRSKLWTSAPAGIAHMDKVGMRRRGACR
jgi:hypothetical protein